MTATALEPATPRPASGLRVAIHQPNVLPWLGFFAKAMQADVLVLLDDVPFSRGSYTNRVRVMGPKGPTWLTVPVAHPCSGVRIDEVKVAGVLGWNGAIRALARVYADAWSNDATLAPIASICARLDVCGELLSASNTALIRHLVGELVGEKPIGLASQFRDVVEPSTAGLIQLCKAVGADVYVEGNGYDYLDREAFALAGIHVERAQFRHPEYPQRRPEGMAFVPGLSVVDCIANVGVERTRELLAESVR